MKTSESIKNIASALAKFQGSVSDPAKTGVNPFFHGSKYVTLDELIKAVRLPLTENGLAFVQSCAGADKSISVTTLLLHTSGEWLESDALVLPLTKNDAQGAGSALTYGRRYSLQSLLGIGWENDDDANSAADTYTEPQAEQKTDNPPYIKNKDSIKILGSHGDYIDITTLPLETLERAVLYPPYAPIRKDIEKLVQGLKNGV